MSSRTSTSTQSSRETALRRQLKPKNDILKAKDDNIKANDQLILNLEKERDSLVIELNQTKQELENTKKLVTVANCVHVPTPERLISVCSICYTRVPKKVQTNDISD